ncbi:hypothetical protein [Pseudanabaena sp. PCC 6802]|uniref:hypothetical protein n=1 Tax=Pseudanabaena sp. PCC 6802 TaxID=118173 RepID=UPI00034DEA3A|nr:hypothetical protein [Pseudanabaena sp. PCC 6802]
MSNKYLEHCQDKNPAERAYTSNSEVVLARLAIAQLVETIHEFSERETKAIAGWRSGLDLNDD